MTSLFTDPNASKPECILRIEKLSNKTVIFEECDITDLGALKKLFKKVNNFVKIILFGFISSFINKFIIIISVQISMCHSFCCFKSGR